MLDSADLDLEMKKKLYKERLPKLQLRLFDMEQHLVKSQLPVLIILEGWAATGKVNIIQAITSRLDPRGLRVHPITAPRTYETQYPWLYRFWLKIPSYGQLAIFDRSWYNELLNERLRNDLDTAEWHRHCEDISSFERQLADDGTIILKFWLHISQKEQSHRFERLLDDKLTAWKVTDDDNWQNRHYSQVKRSLEDLLERTNTVAAPWVIVPATSKHYAVTMVIETILSTLEGRFGITTTPDDNAEPFVTVDTLSQLFHRSLDDRKQLADELKQVQSERAVVNRTVTPTAPATIKMKSHNGVLQQVDLGQSLRKNSYQRERKRLQAQLYQLGFQSYHQKRPVIFVFEGWDAAGKGGAIKRVTEELDPRGFIVHSIAAPDGDDKIRHYLYRFWRRLPARGQIAIFDRSWYGRVLVERVEGFARDDEWQRAYAEINEFERQLVEYGTILCKFWMHISSEEQLRRFEERQLEPHKVWKLTDEDWRNRQKWTQYEEAANEMLLRTSTSHAPWTIVEAEDKYFARVRVMKTVVQKLEQELGPIRL